MSETIAKERLSNLKHRLPMQRWFKESFLRNVTSNFLSSGILLLSHLVLTVILTRLWSESEFARFSIAATLVFCLEVVADLGMRIWAVQVLAVEENTSGNLGRIAYARFLLSGTACALSLLAPITILSFEERLVCGLIAVTQPTVDAGLWLFRAKDKLYLESIVVAVWRVISFAAFALIAFVGSKLDSLLLAWLGANAIRWIVVRFLPHYRSMMGDKGPQEATRLSDAFGVITATFPFGVCVILSNISHRIPLFLVDRFGSTLDLALFGLSTRLLYAFSFISSTVTVATVPSLLKAWERQDRKEASGQFYRGADVICWLIIAIAIVGIPACRFFVGPVFGQAYTGAGKQVGLLFPVLLLMSLNYYFGYLLANLLPRRIEIVTNCGGIALLILLVFMSPHVRIDIRIGVSWIFVEVVKLIARALLVTFKLGLEGSRLRQVAVSVLVLFLVSLLNVSV